MRRNSVWISLVIAGCGTNPRPPATPPPVVAAESSTPAAPAIAPLPFTSEQLRGACFAGREIVVRVERPGAPATTQVMTFVAVDAEGAEIESRDLDATGVAVTTPPVRRRATWEELRRHAAFPAAATTIADDIASTPAGVFDAKVYTVTEGDKVSRFYFAGARPGPPVLLEVDQAGTRVMTMTLLPAVPVACTTVDDCWLDGTTPVARPASRRGITLRPCKDAERLPTCTAAGVCGLVAYKC